AVPRGYGSGPGPKTDAGHAPVSNGGLGIVTDVKTRSTPGGHVDVLVVGAGPTGLTLACQLARFGVRFRIIDKQPDRAHESRALGVQARSLEVLQALGLGEALARRGRTSTR